MIQQKSIGSLWEVKEEWAAWTLGPWGMTRWCIPELPYCHLYILYRHCRSLQARATNGHRLKSSEESLFSLSKGSGTFENTLAKWQTPVERCPLYLLPPGWVEAGRQPSPLTPQGGVSRAEQEANLLSRARQKRASLLPPDGAGRSKWDSLPSGTKSAGIVSAGPSVDLSLCLHPAAMNLKEVVQARTSRPSTFPWAQRDPVGSWASTGSDSVATRQN